MKILNLCFLSVLYTTQVSFELTVTELMIHFLFERSEN